MFNHTIFENEFRVSKDRVTEKISYRKINNLNKKLL